jgi:hypothetical protein
VQLIIASSRSFQSRYSKTSSISINIINNTHSTLPTHHAQVPEKKPQKKATEKYHRKKGLAHLTPTPYNPTYSHETNP